MRIILKRIRLSEALKMHVLFRILIFAGAIISIVACKKDPEIWDTNIDGNHEDSIIYEDPFDKVPDNSDIIMYEVNTFVFSQESNLTGVKNGLDSIKELGINVVWLMPIYPIGEVNSIGSPYCVKDYFSVNPDLGTREDLIELVKEAHKMGMAVILDWVGNHTAWDNSWIANKSWYEQDASGNILSPNSWNDVAELDYSSQEMRKEMIKAMKFWVKETNIDGYRCDYAEGIPLDFWNDAIDSLRAMPGRKIIMFAEGAKKNLFSAGFNLTFGWNFYSKLKAVFNDNESVTNITGANTVDYSGLDDESQILRFTSNHDYDATDDSPINIFNSKEGSMAAFAIVNFMGGVPLIYNGQEVGCPVKLSFFSNSTSQIDWTINPELRDEYKMLLHYRTESKAIKQGDLNVIGENPDVIVFQRIADADTAMVFVNVRNNTITYQLPELLQDTKWNNLKDGTDILLGTSLAMNPYEYYILNN